MKSAFRFAFTLSLFWNPLLAAADETPETVIDEELEALDTEPAKTTVLDAHAPLRLTEPLTFTGVDPEKRVGLQLGIGQPAWRTALVTVDYLVKPRVGAMVEVGLEGDHGTLRLGGRYALLRSSTREWVVTGGLSGELQFSDRVGAALIPEVGAGIRLGSRVDLTGHAWAQLQTDPEFNLEGMAALPLPMAPMVAVLLEGEALGDRGQILVNEEVQGVTQWFVTLNPGVRIKVSETLSVAVGGKIPVVEQFRSDYYQAISASAVWLF